jgi:hypothetical protein
MKTDTRITKRIAPVMSLPVPPASLLFYRFSSCFTKQAFEEKENVWKSKIRKIRLKIKGLYPDLLAPLSEISMPVACTFHTGNELRKLKTYYDAVYTMLNSYIFMALLCRKPLVAKIH